MAPPAHSRHPILHIALAALLSAGCDAVEAPDPGPYDLRIRGLPSGAVAIGEPIRVAVVDREAGTVIARERQTISRGVDQSFGFVFPDLLEADHLYRVVYWVDLNLGREATAGVCDVLGDDHGALDVRDVTGDVSLDVVLDVGEGVPSCEHFTGSLTFQGDAGFQAPHGGQDVTVALLTAEGEVSAVAAGSVSAAADPAFSFTFDRLALGAEYRARYWIDSNFDGGTEGVCDQPANDHQWEIDLGTLEADMTHTEEHRPGETELVCETFIADLTFTGDATFGGAHGGQTVTVGVVDEGDRLVATAEGTVSSTGDPAFSFVFPGQLVAGREYRVDYWIDSNFDGGTEGVCDPPANDHQWRVELGRVLGDVVRFVEHDPAAQTEVCDTFD